MGVGTIYPASRASIPARVEEWKRLRSEGWPISATWLDESGPGETGDWDRLWRSCLFEAGMAGVLVLRIAPEDVPLKGALLEVGAALVSGAPVIVWAEGFSDTAQLEDAVGRWIRHSAVRVVFTRGDIEAVCRSYGLLQ